MKSFGMFLRSHWLYALYLALCLGMISLLFFLCHLPWAPVLYALGLCCAMGLCFLIPCFLRYRRRHLILQGLLQQVGDSVEHLPEPSDQIETDYQALLIRISDLKAELTRSADQSRQDMLEYYTMWVHQIKTPIAAMQLILQDEDSAVDGALRSELFKIQQYVEMVLCYLRLEGKGSDFVFRVCSLDQVLRQAVRTYAGQFIRKKIRLVYHPTETQVLTDEKWLEFVVEQLLSNALKYTISGSVTISVDAQGCLSIRDTGIGIAAQDLPRIMERGYTGLNGRGEQRSTGIGLYLCSRILKKLGHEITFWSRPGRGTEVRISLKKPSLEFD